MIQVNRKMKSKKEELLKKYKKLDVYTNFKQYELQFPEVLRMDCISSPFNPNSFMFDSIVCDPPYGYRAAPKTTGNDKKIREGRNFEKEKQSLKTFYDPNQKSYYFYFNFRFFINV